MNPLQERLQTFLNSEDISMRAFERQCDIKTGTASKMSEKSYGTTFHKIAKAFPRLNIDWLKTGNGEMLNQVPNIDVDFTMDGHSQMAFGNISNIGDAKAQIAVLQERLKALEIQLGEKDVRIAELTASLDRERKMNDYLMGQKNEK